MLDSYQIPPFMLKPTYRMNDRWFLEFKLDHWKTTALNYFIAFWSVINFIWFESLTQLSVALVESYLKKKRKKQENK